MKELKKPPLKSLKEIAQQLRTTYGKADIRTLTSLMKAQRYTYLHWKHLMRWFMKKR